MPTQIYDGNLLDQEVEVIVNSWNRNFIPWWLLLPQGVSGAIKRRGGLAPFRELSAKGMLPLGSAVETGAGKLPFKSIIHVAGIGILWRASEFSVRESVRNALKIADARGYRSLAFPLIGAGTGGLSPDEVMRFMQDEIMKNPYQGDTRIVRFRPL